MLTSKEERETTAFKRQNAGLFLTHLFYASLPQGKDEDCVGRVVAQDSLSMYETAVPS